MGWMETCAMDERMRFVLAVEREEESMAALCRRFGVSRKSGYKWLGRYREDGVAGLADRSRAPCHHPQEVSAELAERCLEVRRAHPTWGPVKVRAVLERRVPQTRWPAASTIGALFDREGLTVKRRLRRRAPPATAPFAACAGANDVWAIDFKGWFLTGDGTRCEPLTLSDAHSRYLLRCQVLAKSDAAHVWPVLDAAFREFGLPERLRSDNGPPFASTGAGGLIEVGLIGCAAGLVPLQKLVRSICIAGRGDQRRQPVEVCHDLVGDRTRLDLAGPANQRGHAVGALPVGVLLAAEWRHRRIRP